MSSFYIFSPDKGDATLGPQKTSFIKLLDSLRSRDGVNGKPTKIAFPAQLRKQALYAHLTNPAGMIESGNRTVTKIDYWKGEREVQIPKGRYAVLILQSEIPRLVALMEADLTEALARYVELKEKIAKGFNP